MEINNADNTIFLNLDMFVFFFLSIMIDNTRITKIPKEISIVSKFCLNISPIKKTPP